MIPAPAHAVHLYSIILSYSLLSFCGDDLKIFIRQEVRNTAIYYIIGKFKNLELIREDRGLFLFGI